MTCGACKKMQADGFRPTCPGIETITTCPLGEVFRLDEENEGIWTLFEELFHCLKDGGKIDVQEIFFRGAACFLIDFLLSAHDVPERQRPEARRMLMRMIPAIERKG
jgi:hypothetical protein